MATLLKILGGTLIFIGTLMLSMFLAMRGPAQEFLRNSTRIPGVITGLRSQHQTDRHGYDIDDLDYFMRVRYQAGGTTREIEFGSTGEPSIHIGSKVELLLLKNGAPDDVQPESVVRRRIWDATMFAVNCGVFLVGGTMLLWARRLARSSEAALKPQKLAA